jgi:hypothetical protein
VETPPAYILTSYEKYIPPPCIPQASREEALEDSSANGKNAPRSRARSACSPLVGTSWVSLDAHEVGEGHTSGKQQQITAASMPIHKQAKAAH